MDTFGLEKESINNIVILQLKLLVFVVWLPTLSCKRNQFLYTIRLECFIVSLYHFSFIFVIKYVLFEWKRICAGFLSFVYIYILSWENQLSKGGGGIPLAGLTSPYICGSTKPAPGFPTSYVVVFLCLVGSVNTRDDCSFCRY